MECEDWLEDSQAANRALQCKIEALQAIVDCCRELVPTLYGKVQEDLAGIVGWPKSKGE